MNPSRWLFQPRLWATSLFFSLILSFSAQAQIRTIQTDIQHDVSPPLRDLARSAPSPAVIEPREAEPVRAIPLPPGLKPASEPDKVLQQTTAVTPEASAPTIGLNFDGIGQGVPPNFSPCCAPPDTNGAVGLTQYVQWVNISFSVFDKTNGNVLMGPTFGNTLWHGFGGACQTNNDGDPIITYDKLNNRWIFSQFAVRNVNNFLTNTLQCIAVSTGSDATGPYNRYAFQYNNEIDDYPKMGVWPDAYYETFNMFDSVSLFFLGADVCAYDGNAMRNGLTATQVCFQQASNVGGMLPSDVDGHTPPPAGSPNFVLNFGLNSLNLYKFHVDFTTPSNSTFTGPTNIPVSPFTPLCNGGTCVPENSGDGTVLDSLGDRLMYRLAYRNFGDHESLVLNHSVATASGGGGIRWYEIQNPNGTPQVVQQSTFAPDSNFRWMGSIAMDVSGNIAVGYSVSSNTMFPSIAMAGRTPSDPASTLETEIPLFSGTGAQTFGLNRWGDYSAMQVDPVDDCTFWYTTEYLKNSGTFNWNTRIVNFKFPFCGQPDLTIASAHTGNFTQKDTGDTYTLTVTNLGGKPTDGSTVTVTDTLPTGLTATAISGTGWSCTLGTLTCTRSDALAPRSAYPTITVTVNVAVNAPGIVTNTATVSGGGDQNTSNNSTSDQTTVIQLGPDPAITKSHTGNFIQSQTGTYSITVTNTGLSPTDGTTVTVTDALPTGFTFNAASGTGWTCVSGPPVSCTRSDVLASNKSYPPIILIVNVANNAPPSVTNTATVVGGGDTNNLNNTANDPTTVTPPPPDLTITKSHTGNFNQGQQSVSYTMTVSNVGGTPTSGLVTVTDTLPTGLNGVGSAGIGWFCGFFPQFTCTRNDVLAAGASYPPITLFVTVANNAPASVTNTATVSGGGETNTSNDTATDPTTINPSPDLTITKTHTPDPFIVGSTGTYTLTVNNVGNAATSGTVTVNDSLPSGLSATAISGTGWSCSATPTTFFTCTRSDALAAGSSYTGISVTVAVTGGAPQVINNANVSGGGEFNTSNDSASDVTNINGPILSIVSSHNGNFTVGLTGTYTITVSNVGQTPTNGTQVNVGDGLPTSLTAIAVSGTGWTCPTVLPATVVNCNRSDALNNGSSYPPITLTTSVGANVLSGTSNFVNVTGGGDLNTHFFSDLTNFNLPDLAIAIAHNGNFTLGETGATYTITVSNVGTIATADATLSMTDLLPFSLSATAAAGTGWTCNIPFATNVSCTRSAGVLAPGSSYPPITLTVNVSPTAPSSVTNSVSVGGISDANLANNTASDVVNIGGVSITPGSTTVTVNAGSIAGFPFTAGLGANAGTVTFNATGLPQNSAVSFTPTLLTVSGGVLMAIDTSGAGHVAALSPAGGERNPVTYLAVIFAFVAILGSRAKNRRRYWLATSIGAITLILLVAGCGGGGPPPPPTPPPVTPSGTYNITMTATSSNPSIAPINTQFTLVVK